jgi:starvation-inducible DNA-binding protein
MKPNIEISEGNLKAAATLLNALLAEEYVLYTRTRNAHWNVQGQNFMELHKFFQGQYEALDEIIDEVAERVRSLGHFALGSLNEFISVARLTEQDHKFSNQKEIIQTLLDDHETLIRIMRKDSTTTSETLRDLGTCDFITGLMEQHEKMAWMLRAHISS